MNTIKCMIAAIGIVGLSAVAQEAPLVAPEPEAEIGKVEISGYLDMSGSATQKDEAGNKSTTSSLGLDAAEIRLKSRLADGVSAETHIMGDGENGIALEQAFLSYTGVSNVTINAGKFLSSLGWEAYHAPDLYQYSFALGGVIPGMQNGVSASYSTDMFSVYGAALSSVWDNADTEARWEGLEASAKFTGVEGLTLFAGYATENPQETDVISYEDQQTLANLWASYEVGKLTLAAEFNTVSNFQRFDEDGNPSYIADSGSTWLVMANYGFTDKFGLTLRTSAMSFENAAGTTTEEATKFTIAPSYVLTDNLSFVLEYNTIDYTLTDDTEQTIALEAIVTF